MKGATTHKTVAFLLEPGVEVVDFQDRWVVFQAIEIGFHLHSRPAKM